MRSTDAAKETLFPSFSPRRVFSRFYRGSRHMSGMKEGDVSHQFRRHEGAGHSTQYLLSGQTARATHAEHTPQRPRSTQASTPLRGTYGQSLRYRTGRELTSTVVTGRCSTLLMSR